MSNLVNNQAGGPDRGREKRPFLPCTAGGRHSVTQLRHLNEVDLHALFAALIAKGLGQVSFACSGFANESEVLVGVDSR